MSDGLCIVDGTFMRYCFYCLLFVYSFLRATWAKGFDGVKGEEGRGQNRRKKEGSKATMGNGCWTVVAKRLISHARRIQTIL